MQKRKKRQKKTVETNLSNAIFNSNSNNNNDINNNTGNDNSSSNDNNKIKINYVTRNLKTQTTNTTDKICQKCVFNDVICPNKTISLSCSTHME